MCSTVLLSDADLADAFAGCTTTAARSICDRRASRRWSFPAVQPLAPYGHHGLPKPEMFSHVRCYDLSAGGVSFYTKGPPKFEFGVIGLGPAKQRQFFVIHVVHRREANPGTNEYLVGCQFVERIDQPTAGEPAG
jgi:hypothetical protein